MGKTFRREAPELEEMPEPDLSEREWRELCDSLRKVQVTVKRAGFTALDCTVQDLLLNFALSMKDGKIVLDT